MNTMTMTGNLVADPEAHSYGDGQELVTFRIGNSEWNGTQSVPNGFFDITTFNKLAENVKSSLRKGDRVIVSGRLQHTVYENPDGSKGSRTKVIANTVALSLEFEPAHRAATTQEATA